MKIRRVIVTVEFDSDDTIKDIKQYFIDGLDTCTVHQIQVNVVRPKIVKREDVAKRRK